MWRNDSCPDTVLIRIDQSSGVGLTVVAAVIYSIALNLQRSGCSELSRGREQRAKDK